MAIKLAGQYHTDKSNLLKPDLHLVIGTRHKPAANKPKNYLLIKTGKQFKYLSSLYPFDQDISVSPTDAQIFSLDWQGVQYLLTLKTGEKQAEISLLETGSNTAMPKAGGGTGSTFP